MNNEVKEIINRIKDVRDNPAILDDENGMCDNWLVMNAKECKLLLDHINQLESTLNEVREWKEEFGDACTFSIVSNPSLGGWYYSLEDILDKVGGSNE